MQINHPRSATAVQRRTFVSIPSVLGITAPVNSWPTLITCPLQFTPSAAVVNAYDSYRVVNVRWFFCMPDAGDMGTAQSLPYVACHDPTASSAVTNCSHISRYANHTTWFAQQIGGRFETITLKNVQNRYTGATTAEGSLSRLPIKTEAIWDAGTIYASPLWANNIGFAMGTSYAHTFMEYDVELYGPRVDV